VQKTDPLTADQIKDILAKFLNLDVPDLVLALLSLQPLSRHGPREWVDFSEISVDSALRTSCICRNSGPEHPGYGVEAREHLIATILTWFETYAEEMLPIRTPWFGDDGSHERNLKALKERFHHPQTRLSIGEAIDQLFEPNFDKRLTQAFFSEPNSDGFYHTIYGGDPESVADGFAAYMRDAGVKRMVFRAPFHGHQLSVFRSKRYSEGSNRAYEVEAVIHSMDDKLIAKVGMLLMYSGSETAVEEIISHFDETDHSDAQEAAIRIAELYTEGMVACDSLQRVCLIRNWEVVSQFRGNKLGVDLLMNAVQIGTRNLPNIRLFAARLTPADMSVPPYAEMSEERYPALVGPVQRLESYWDGVVWPSLKKANKQAAFAKIAYVPGCWRGTQAVLYALGAARFLVRKYESELADVDG
jgi:hypothetical protein